MKRRDWWDYLPPERRALIVPRFELGETDVTTQASQLLVVRA